MINILFVEVLLSFKVEQSF